MSDKCPKCGAALDMEGKYVKDYACGSIENKSGWFLQRDACKDRQIAQLQERLEETKGWLGATIRHFDLAGSRIFGFHGANSLYYGIKKCLDKSLGEI